MTENPIEWLRPVPGTDGEMFIQWKNTSVCLDFWCPTCNGQLHYDGLFAYLLKCPRCESVYRLGTQVLARKVEGEPDGPLRVMEDDSDDLPEACGNAANDPL